MEGPSLGAATAPAAPANDDPGVDAMDNVLEMFGNFVLNVKVLAAQGKSRV